MACSSLSPSPVVSGGSTLRTNNFQRISQQHRSLISISSFLCCTPVNPGPQYLTSSKHKNCLQVFACSSSQPQKTATNFKSSQKLFVSGLSFRTSEESLRNAFQSFGPLIEVNLVMDKIANRPRGFAFLRYATKEESEKAIEGMHGKFLDGRVIFVEYAKPRSQLHQSVKQDSKPNR